MGPLPEIEAIEPGKCYPVSHLLSFARNKVDTERKRGNWWSRRSSGDTWSSLDFPATEEKVTVATEMGLISTQSQSPLKVLLSCAN